MKPPTVFLSLSGHDAGFVERVHAHLPAGMAHFYPKSFANGEELISAMEERVGTAEVFVLFASAKSLDSHWVRFEIDRARVASITDSTRRLLVFPIEHSLPFDSLPAWLKEHWIPNAGLSPRDVARYIRNVLFQAAVAGTPLQNVYGRGHFVDQAVQSLTTTVVTTGNTPNVMIFAGVAGIGRRTVARPFLRQANPSLPDVAFGPELNLPQFADIEDVYRALRQEVDPKFDLENLKADLAVFRELSLEEQAQEVFSQLRYFGTLGQAVTVVTSNGLFEDRGVLKAWAPALFRQLEEHREVKLVLVANRQAHEKELRPHPNVIQFSVPPLQDGDIKSIIVAVLSSLGSKPQLPSNPVLRSMGGHPEIARLACRVIAQKGVAVFERDPSDLFSIQNDVLSESINPGSLKSAEAEVLSVLSWVPQMDGRALEKIITTRHSLTTEGFAELITDLVLACLIESSGDTVSISSAIRSHFRRFYGYGNPELQKTFAASLRQRWKEARDGELRIEVIDALVYMAALEGGTLPAEFRDIVPAATLQAIIKEMYDNGHDDDEALERVIAWGETAIASRMNETTREEILSYVYRAHVRLGQDDRAEDVLKIFETQGYRSLPYLRGFKLRRRGQLRPAISAFIEARSIRKYEWAVMGELAECYKALAMWTELRDLIKNEADRIDRNPALMDIWAGLLIAERKFSEAERVIDRLRRQPNDDGRADTRTALIMMRRDGNFRDAVTLLTRVLNRVSSGKDSVRRLRAMAAAQAGDTSLAKTDAEALRARQGSSKAAERIDAYIALEQKDYHRAFELLSVINPQTAQDRLLEARICEAKANDPRTSLAERQTLRQRAVLLRSRYSIVDEMEVAR